MMREYKFDVHNEMYVAIPEGKRKGLPCFK